MILILILVVLILLVIVYWLFMSSYSQVFGRYIWRVKTKDKLIAMTFDDGPNEPYTSQILDILSENNIKATFFMVGKCIERYPEAAKKVLAAGHSIGNHSVSHQFRNYFKPKFYELEIQKNQEIFNKYLNITPTLYRSPWLWRYPSLLRRLKFAGFTPISGNFCHSLEVFKINANKIARSAIKKSKPGAIIIFHDGKEGVTGVREQTVQAVRLVVAKLLKDNYKFVSVDELLKKSTK
ncbi:MAG TPA: polysaccharide deacetylase family protein [Candidatus Dormibacteraeota bacterium]|nr:polysaccharide deacetylase family protein [Candidatus Dormibacteraeota bacterium]